MKTEHEIWFDKVNIYLKNDDGEVVYLPLEAYQPLLNASIEEKNQFEFSPYGVHWRKLDEDLCFDGFIPITV